MIPNHLAPILDRIGVSQDRWFDATTKFDELFRRIAGNARDIAEQAAKAGKAWFHGIRSCREIFTAEGEE